MQDRMQLAIEAGQEEAIKLAETKLGRQLTEVERGGLRRIVSLMMLESVCRSFAAPGVTQAQVLADLEHFSRE